MERTKTGLLIALFVMALGASEVFGNSSVVDVEVWREYKMREYQSYVLKVGERKAEIKRDILEGSNLSFTAVLSETSERIEEVERNSIQSNLESFEKVVIASVKEAREYEIWTRSYWTKEDFEAIIPDTLKGMIPVALEMEEEIGVSAIYLLAVAANETGWGRYMAGRYNYYNWSNDGRKYFDFSSLEEFKEFSIGAYLRGYSEPEHFKKSYGRVPDKITVEVVNTKYAPHLSGGTNWIWTDTVSKIMKSLSDKRLKNLAS